MRPLALGEDLPRILENQSYGVAFRVHPSDDVRNSRPGLECSVTLLEADLGVRFKAFGLLISVPAGLNHRDIFPCRVDRHGSSE